MSSMVCDDVRRMLNRSDNQVYKAKARMLSLTRERLTMLRADTE